MSRKKYRKRRRAQNNLLVLRLLILVVLVLVIFEGKLIFTMFTQRSSSQLPSPNEGVTNQIEEETENGSTAEQIIYHGNTGTDATLAGIPSVAAPPDYTPDSSSAESDIASQIAQSEALNSKKVVPKRSPSVDDSYFTDAVFIGDSRMEGFRNASGITQGDFMTSIGMTLTSISDTQIMTADGPITVYQGLSGKQYNKIYLMLGTNDLGFWPMSEFLPTALSVLNQFHNLQPHAVIYICSVIYVEESQVVTDYVNNANVMEVNKNLLQACEQLDFCYFINLNEIFSDGWHELIPGISQDGVHLYAPYLEQMLDYFKNHYIPDNELQAMFGGSSASAVENQKPDTDSESTDDNDSGQNSDQEAGNDDASVQDNEDTDQRNEAESTVGSIKILD